MAINAALAECFEEIASLLELLEEDKFRINAHAKAARSIRDLTTDLATIAEDEAALKAIDGIGAKTAAKITEFVRTGTITELAELRERVPAGLPVLLEVPGLGPKTVRLAWKELGVEDLAGLKAAVEDGRLAGLPRMGEKAVEKIRKGIEQLERSVGRLPLGTAMPIGERVVEYMLKVEGVRQAAFAGSLRRGKESIGDIDVLVVATDPQRAHKAFCTMDGVADVIASGESKSSVLMSLPSQRGRWARAAGENAAPAVQVDLRVVQPEAWGAALLYFTGSKEHNVLLRQRAIDRGMTLNEYGLFEDDDPQAGPPQKRGIAPKASQTEEQVYAALDLQWLPPEIREDRGELGWKAEPLIEVADVRAELHAHTTASDGGLTLDELVQRAVDRGFHTIAVTDHSKSSAQAGGLNEARLAEQAAEIEQARERFGKQITILKGSEVDILADGSLDFDDDTLALLDVVVASPHTALSQDAAIATKRLLKAIEHPMVHILGHPTGRLVERRAGLDPDMNELIAAAVEHQVALEINAHWMRLDLRDTHVRAAVEAGCLIAINCDVHGAHDFDNLRYGVMTARRGWLTPEQCINCWPAKKLHKWLKQKR